MGSPWKEETVRLGVDKAIFSAGLKLSSLFVQKCIKMCEKSPKKTTALIMKEIMPMFLSNVIQI